MKKHLRHLTGRVGAILATTLALACGSVHAQRADVVHLLVAFPPGGSSDLLARILADTLSTELKTTVIVDNRPGGNGAIAANVLSNARPDGHTLWLTTAGAIAINPELYPKLSYDINRLTPVALVAHTGEVLVVNAKNPATDALDFVKSAASHSDLTIASSGIGSMPHMGVALLGDATGGQFNHIPEKGIAPAVSDLLGGHVDAVIADVSAVMSQVKSGQFRVIGVGAKARNPLFPNAKTFDEMGMKGVYLDNWSAIVVNNETPQALVDSLSQALRKTVESPVVQQRLADLGVQAQWSTPAQLTQQIRADRAQWHEVIVKHQIKPE